MLAPMAGFTNAAMRRICHQHGALMTFTEMVSAIGLLRAGEKTWRLLETLPHEAPVVAHLYGSEPGALAEACNMVSRTGRFCAIDLNAGCPVRKVTASGAGAALLHHPQRIYDILRAMRKATDLPLTIKTRPGPSPALVTIFEILEAAHCAGADAIAVHARFSSRGHSGAPDLALLAKIKARAKIPVLGNGGIISAQDAFTMVRETGVDGVMVARGALGNPWIFSEIARYARGIRGETNRDPAQIAVALRAHLKAEAELWEQEQKRQGGTMDASVRDTYLATAFRTHLYRYLRGLQGAARLRANLRFIRTTADIQTALESYIG